MENKLKEVREEKGVSISELSRRAKVSRSRIYAIENGEAESVTTGMLSRIAIALGVSVSDIFVL